MASATSRRTRRFASAFTTKPEFWLNLQAHYNVVETRLVNMSEYQAIRLRPMFNKAA